MTGVRILCFGNPLHGDDGFGVHVYRRVTARPLPAHVDCFDVGTRGLDALHLLEGCRKAVLVDAIAGDEPGAVRRFEPTEVEVGEALSLHALGVEQLLACLPIVFDGVPAPRIVVLGAEIGRAPRCFTSELSPAVAAAVEVAALRLAEEWG